MSNQLTPLETSTLAQIICGDGSPSFARRKRRDLDEFYDFTGVGVDHDRRSERFFDAHAFVLECNKSALGQSGLPGDIEKVILALVNRRCFATGEAQDEAIGVLNSWLVRAEAEVFLASDGEVAVRRKAQLRGQGFVVRQITNTYLALLEAAELSSALAHYRKALERLRGGDYPNAAKEAVCSIEAITATITGIRNLEDALKGEHLRSLIPMPLDQQIRKIYAYRGNESGVAHGTEELPSINECDATFIVLQSASIGMFLLEKLKGRD